MMGIGKQELMEDYYPGELTAIMQEWTVLHTPAEDREEQVEDLGETDPETFLAL